jgi:hypothetical protein
LRRVLTVAIAIAALVVAAPASANDRFTLDTQPTSPGHVVVDSTGTAYVTWTHKSASTAPDSVMFCKIPLGGTCTAPKTLPIPGAVDATDEVAGVFPVLGPGTSVYVVAPRYVEDDVVIWTSLDGGQSFNGGTVNPGGYSGKSEPTNVLLPGSSFLIGASNPGLGFSTTPAGGGAGSKLSFESEVGSIGSSSMGFDGGANLVEAYWTLEGSEYPMFFYRYKGSIPITSESSWEGPIPIGTGYETKLAGGSGGIFLVSQGYPPGSTTPSALQVRRYGGSSFGAPVTLANDSVIDLFAGGAIAESPNGHLAVAWPGTRGGDSAKVMRLFSSADGSSFVETDVAHIGGAYALGDNAQLALGDSGAGWLTFRDEGGLKMADLNPVAPYVPPKPPTFKGKEKTISKPVGDFELTLRLPKSCLQPSQPFYAGAGKRVRHKVAKALHSRLKLVKAAFSFDGKKLKTLKKKPLKLLISPGPLPAGSKHTVAVKITAIASKNGEQKKVVRTLKGQISIC